MKFLKILLFTTGCYFFLLSLSLSAVQNETGTLSGSAKVSRSRHSGDVIIYLEGEGIKKEYPSPTKRVPLDQKNLLFTPRVLPILKGSTVDFLNTDEVRHNIFAPGKVEKFNLGTWGLGGVKVHTFNKPGEVILLCNVHSEMVAYILVLENPYFAKSDQKGNFKIENIPPGTYTVKIWHEKMMSPSQEVVITSGETAVIKLELKERK